MRTNRRKRKKQIPYVKIAVLAVLIIILLLLMINGILFLVDMFSGEKAVETGMEQSNIEVTETESAAESVEAGSAEAETETETQTAEAEDGKMRVILDAGHGGNDGGTSSGKLIEKVINLDIAMKMKPLLEEKGLEVVMTREEDDYMGLDERAIAANQAGGDLFLSIHCNYYQEGSPISGVECYYYDNAEEGKKCAETILSELKAGGKIAARNAKEQNYYVLKNTSMTAVLIEVGYLSSPTDRLNLGSQKYQQTMAEELVKGVCTYLESLEKEAETENEAETVTESASEAEQDE